MKRNLTTENRLSQKKTWLAAKPLLGKLVKWTVLVFLAATVTVIVFYVIGSYRRASDSSQLALVNFCLVFSLLLAIASIYGLILDLFYAVRKQRLIYLTGAFGYMVTLVLGFVCVLGAAFIIGAVGGNR